MKKPMIGNYDSNVPKQNHSNPFGLDKDVKQFKDQSSFRWYAFLLTLIAMATGAWFFFNSIMEKIDPIASVQSGPFDNQSTATVKPKASAETSADLPKKQPPAPQSIATNDKIGISPSVASNASLEPFLLVSLSTKSQDEAITQARALQQRGYGSKVILSKTGYYAVVLEYDSYEEAQAAGKALAASGAIQEKPYVMKTDRVKQVIPYGTD